MTEDEAYARLSAAAARRQYQVGKHPEGWRVTIYDGDNDAEVLDPVKTKAAAEAQMREHSLRELAKAVVAP